MLAAGRFEVTVLRVFELLGNPVGVGFVPHVDSFFRQPFQLQDRGDARVEPEFVFDALFRKIRVVRHLLVHFEDGLAVPYILDDGRVGLVVMTEVRGNPVQRVMA